MIVGQGPTVLAVGAGGGCLDIFTFIYLTLLFLPLFENASAREFEISFLEVTFSLFTFKCPSELDFSFPRILRTMSHTFLTEVREFNLEIYCFQDFSLESFIVRQGWSGGAMVLGKLPVPGRPTIWITVGQGPTALAVGAGGGCLDIFTLIYPFFPLSPSLWETARYRLKYCLKRPLNPKQPTNQLLYDELLHKNTIII